VVYIVELVLDLKRPSFSCDFAVLESSPSRQEYDSFKKVIVNTMLLHININYFQTHSRAVVNGGERLIEFRGAANYSSSTGSRATSKFR
jgi:hypothetical protein